LTGCGAIRENKTRGKSWGKRGPQKKEKTIDGHLVYPVKKRNTQKGLTTKIAPRVPPNPRHYRGFVTNKKPPQRMWGNNCWGGKWKKKIFHAEEGKKCPGRVVKIPISVVFVVVFQKKKGPHFCFQQEEVGGGGLQGGRPRV